MAERKGTPLSLLCWLWSHPAIPMLGPGLPDCRNSPLLLIPYSHTLCSVTSKCPPQSTTSHVHLWPMGISKHDITKALKVFMQLHLFPFLFFCIPRRTGQIKLAYLRMRETYSRGVTSLFLAKAILDEPTDSWNPWHSGKPRWDLQSCLPNTHGIKTQRSMKSAKPRWR